MKTSLIKEDHHVTDTSSESMTSEMVIMANTYALSNRVNSWPLFCYLEKAYIFDLANQTLKTFQLGERGKNILEHNSNVVIILFPRLRGNSVPKCLCTQDAGIALLFHKFKDWTQVNCWQMLRSSQLSKMMPHSHIYAVMDMHYGPPI